MVGWLELHSTKDVVVTDLYMYKSGSHSIGAESLIRLPHIKSDLGGQMQTAERL